MWQPPQTTRGERQSADTEQRLMGPHIPPPLIDWVIGRLGRDLGQLLRVMEGMPGSPFPGETPTRVGGS